MNRLVLIDDHHIVREGFKRLFETDDSFEVVGEASNPEEAVEVCRRLTPDLIMVDISLGGPKSGLDLLPELAEVCPTSKRVVVSMHDDPALVVRALSQGANGFISKAEAPHVLVSLLGRVMEGETVTSGDVRRSSLRVELTDRERDIIRGIVADKPPKVIAYDLGISDKTLYRQRANLMEKLGARTSSDVARMAQEHGWLLD